MPHGCSVWPAWWYVFPYVRSIFLAHDYRFLLCNRSVGPSWPDAGEIGVLPCFLHTFLITSIIFTFSSDIIEGVNTQTTNQYTLHTTSGCTLDKTNSSNNLFTANVLNTQCESVPSDNTGCAFLDTDTTTYGKGFNDIAGGVFAHLWDDTGISVWHFKRTDIPDDISSRNPDPTSWGTPAAFWSSASCDIGNHFYDHVLTLTTTLCGDWAGPAFTSTCSGTCADAVADPTNFLCEFLFLFTCLFLFICILTSDVVRYHRREMDGQLHCGIQLNKILRLERIIPCV